MEILVKLRLLQQVLHFH